MSYTIPLEKLPSQLLGVTIADAGYVLLLRDVNGLILADIDINGARVLTGAKCLPNQKIIPAPYQTQGGNFYFYCQDNEYPDYTKFGEGHTLMFLTNDEIANLSGV